MNNLLTKLKQIDKETDWLQIANECSMEKQIEIRAEIGRAIKRIEKEMSKNGN